MHSLTQLMEICPNHIDTIVISRPNQSILSKALAMSIFKQALDPFFLLDPLRNSVASSYFPHYSAEEKLNKIWLT